MAIKPDRFSLLAGRRYGRAEFQRRGLGKRGHETWPKLAQKFPSVDNQLERNGIRVIKISLKEREYTFFAAFSLHAVAAVVA